MVKIFIILLLLFSVFNSYKSLSLKNDKILINNLKTNDVDNVNELNSDEYFNNFEIENILFGKWKIICLYTILPNVFEFDQFSSFDKYDEISQDPIVKKIIEPYDVKLLNKEIEFSKEYITLNIKEKIYNPNYIFKKIKGEVYSDELWDRYRPFHDFFRTCNFEYYYSFNITNEYELSEFSILPRGFIVSDRYMICPIHDDWLFYVLEKQEY